MGEWHKHQYPDLDHPCTNCQSGGGGVTSEFRNGELWTKSDDCHETCEQLRDYREGKGSMVDTSYVLTPRGYKKRTFI